MKILLSRLHPVRPARAEPRRLRGEPRPFVPAKTKETLRNLTPPRSSVPRLGPDEITEHSKEQELRQILTAAGAYTPDLFRQLLTWEKKL